MKKRVIKKRMIAAIAAVALFMTGCSAAKDIQTAEDTLETVDVVLDWYPNAVHAFLYEGIEKGYFEEEGLKVNILFPSNANDAISLTAAGKADIGLYYQEDIILSKANENIPVKAIGTVVREPISVIAALADKNIKTPQDLVGKTIGYSTATFGETIVAELINGVKGDPQSVNLIDVGFDLMSAMTTGNVDATYGCFLNHEIPALQEEGFEVDYFLPSDFGIPKFYSLVFVAGEENLAKKSDTYAKFLRACQKGFADMKQNPKEALEILMKHQNEENFPLSLSVEEKSMEVLLPCMENKSGAFLTQDKALWQENIDWCESVGIIQDGLQAEDVVLDLITEE